MSETKSMPIPRRWSSHSQATGDWRMDPEGQWVIWADVREVIEWAAGHRAETGVCWFCRREVPIDTLIAGYDTFEESRLACNTCNDAIQWLNAHGLVVSRTPEPVR